MSVPLKIGFTPLVCCSSCARAAACALALWIPVTSMSADVRAPRLSINLPHGQSLAGGVAISPDGSSVVYTPRNEDPKAPQQLWVRPIDSFEARSLAGTENARQPFFSPDGEWIGYFVDNQLMKISLTGGRPVTVSTLSLGARDGSWGADGYIVYGAGYGKGLARVSANGGRPETLTHPNRDQDELQHMQPAILPGGEKVLFTIETSNRTSIAVLSVSDGEYRVLDEIGERTAAPRYLPSGHLFYETPKALMVAPFDFKTGLVTDPPVSVIDEVPSFPRFRQWYAVSDTGTLVYTPRNTPSEFPKETVVAVTRDGQPRPIANYIGYGGSPRVSPDGTKIVVVARTGPAMPDLWLHDVKMAKTARLTTSGGGAPVWSPDGRWIAFGRLAHGTWDVYRIRADGSSGAEALVVGKDHQYPASWSSDGSSLFLVEQNQTGVRDLLVLSPVAPGTPTALVATAARERAPMISPNGQLLAYVSNETGRDEVYVQRYPGMIRRVQVSTDGGAEPMWSPDGEELFYRNEDQMLVVSLTAEGTVKMRPRVLFEGSFVWSGPSGHPSYDVSPGGKGFVMLATDPTYELLPSELHVILDWRTAIRA